MDGQTPLLLVMACSCVMLLACSMLLSCPNPEVVGGGGSYMAGLTGRESPSATAAMAVVDGEGRN